MSCHELMAGETASAGAPHSTVTMLGAAMAVTTRCAFYCASKPAKVECENADVTWEWRAPDGLLLVRACCTAFSTCLRVTITMEPE